MRAAEGQGQALREGAMMLCFGPQEEMHWHGLGVAGRIHRALLSCNDRGV
jgi:hypothetical protein